MGMFDNITCEYPLPLPDNQGELQGKDWRKNQFQTKDFECLMDEYCIREDGTLWQQAYTWETTRKGRPRRKPAEWRAVSAYTGTVCFCDSIYGNKADYWVDWSAVLVSGEVTEIKLLTWEERDNRERLAWAAEMKARGNAFSPRGSVEGSIRFMRGLCMAASACRCSACATGSEIGRAISEFA